VRQGELGADCARRDGPQIKNERRSVLKAKKAKEEEEKRERSGCNREKDEKKASVWCACGCLNSANETIPPSQCLSKWACVARVCVSSAGGE